MGSRSSLRGHLQWNIRERTSCTTHHQNQISGVEIEVNETAGWKTRQPEELGNIGWVIDRKDRTITQMEETWSTLILPMGESAFAQEPLVCLLEEDYSHFNARYAFTEATADPRMIGHMQWLRSAVGKPPLGTNAKFTDANRLLSEQLVFEDSRNCLGLQLADMLASVLCRALNDRLQISGWKDFGGLLVRRREPGTGFIQLGVGGDVPMPSHAAKVCRVLHAKAKAMLR